MTCGATLPPARRFRLLRLPPQVRNVPEIILWGKMKLPFRRVVLGMMQSPLRCWQPALPCSLPAQH